MPQLTSRDEAMLDWMNVVRLADVEAIRWALTAFQDYHDGAPVSIRRANHWIARMTQLGYLGRVRPMYRDRQIVWPTYSASGRAAPRLFRQTMRHELAVAMASGRYLASGYAWARDRPPLTLQDHQADGVAIKGSEVELIEVELTAKKLARYGVIHSRLANRITKGEATRITYFCSSQVARVVEREADRNLFRDVRPFLSTTVAFDEQGNWIAMESQVPITRAST